MHTGAHIKDDNSYKILSTAPTVKVACPGDLRYGKLLNRCNVCLVSQSSVFYMQFDSDVFVNCCMSQINFLSYSENGKC